MKFMLCAIAALCAVAQAQFEKHEPMTPYSFGYTTADGMSRTESGAGNAVQGSYSYIDANGDTRQVRYIADAHGFRPEGDISVDKKTAIAAAALAAMAPKAPAPIAPAPQQHWAPTPVQHQAPSFRSFNSFENMQKFAAPAAPAWGAPVASPIAFNGAGQPVSYQIETPTHKIWVKY